ncbi:MAG: lactate utilization protein [Lachnoclostridium sp.]|nr:lactate utilization protein [Lachnoclostridium sp.]
MKTANNDTRDAILTRVHGNLPVAYDLPEITSVPVEGDPVENFKAMLKGFDGAAWEFNSREEALKWLRGHIKDDRLVCSAVADYPAARRPADYPDPRRAVDVDVFVAESHLGVGEMGSVWLTDAELGIASLALLCTDLYVLLDRKKIVADMYDAYAAIDLAAHYYGSFFTGPSATADIEAVHVTGAQGEISLTALLY